MPDMPTQLKTMDVVSVGSLNADLVVSTPRFPTSGETVTGSTLTIHCGGKGANQAYAASRAGAKAAMVGQVGGDSFGKDLIQNLLHQGIETNGVKVIPHHATGTALIEVAASGENRIIVIPGANGVYASETLNESESLIQEAKCVLLQMEISQEANAHVMERIGRSADSILIFDPAPAGPICNKWLKVMDYITPNQSELNLLTGQNIPEDAPLEDFIDAGRILCQRGAACVIVKLGSLGALKVTQTDFYHSPAPRVKALDTTAAGDCFNGVFATALALGTHLHASIDRAVQAAAISVTRRGAQASMPEGAEIRDQVD